MVRVDRDRLAFLRLVRDDGVEVLLAQSQLIVLSVFHEPVHARMQQSPFFRDIVQIMFDISH